VIKFAREGSTLTFLGKISYDVKNDKFMITECLGFVGGGFEECYDFLSRRYDFISEWGKKLLTVGIISVLIGGVIVYLNRRMKRYASTLDQSTE
jgi:hypothetical protein